MTRRIRLLAAVADFLHKMGESLYSIRSEVEHQAIRESIRFDPKTCKHLKAEKTRRKEAFYDYNVSQHTFINGITRIRCNNCGTKWFKGDPGWEEALRMMKSTTNRPSSSEMPYEFLNGKEK